MKQEKKRAYPQTHTHTNNYQYITTDPVNTYWVPDITNAYNGETDATPSSHDALLSVTSSTTMAYKYTIFKYVDEMS